jgi:hypothetical protein
VSDFAAQGKEGIERQDGFFFLFRRPQPGDGSLSRHFLVHGPRVTLTSLGDPCFSGHSNEGRLQGVCIIVRHGTGGRAHASV